MSSVVAVVLFAALAAQAQIQMAWRMGAFDASGKSSSGYVGSSQNNAVIYQVAGPTGHVRPSSKAPFTTLERPGTVIDTDDTAYFSVQVGFAAVLYNGSTLWNFTCPQASPNAISSPALTADYSGVVVVCSGQVASQVFLLSTASGSPAWSQPAVIPAEVTASPIIDDATSTPQVFIAALDGSIQAILLADGAQSWTSPASTANNDPIQGTPCFDGLYLYVFTTGGSAYSFDASTGAQVWTIDVTNGAPGFSSSCSLQATTDGSLGALVAAGAWDFKLYVLNVSPSDATIFCTYTSGNIITQGIASMNSTFLVPSMDNTLTAVYPIPLICQSVFQLTNVWNPSRPAFDGHLTAIVGTNTGLYAFDGKWISLLRQLWDFGITGETFNSPAIGPNGNIFASTAQNTVYGIGVTSNFIQTHTRQAAMAATANLGDPTALAELSFLCNTITLALNQPYVGPTSNWNVTQAINETCSMLSLVLAGQDPYGAAPSYIDFQQPSTFISLLQEDLRQNLIDIDNQIANFTSSEASIENQLNNMYAILNGYETQRQQLENAAAQTMTLMETIGSSIVNVEVRLRVLSDLLEGMIEGFLNLWITEASNFLAAALADDKAGVEEFKDALAEFGAAAHALLNPFHWGRIKGYLDQGMADLKKAIDYMLEAVFWTAEAAEFLEAYVALEQVNTFVTALVQIDDDLMHNNLSFAQALPQIFKAELDVSVVQGWLEYAVAKMKVAPGGALVAPMLNEFLADSEALYNSDFAFYAVYNQYQSQIAQIASMNIQIQEIVNSIAELQTPFAGVGSALQAAWGQQYAVQISVIQTARQACEQYMFWTLEACPSSVAMPAYPTPTDIDTFVTQFQEMVIAANQTVTGLMWAQITFNTTSNPESFVNASQGLFYLQVYMPANCSFYNVRTTDYRAYFLPNGTEIASLMNVEFSHSGLSQFTSVANNETYQFTHEPWSDPTSFYYPNTEACPYSEHVCQAPQCSSEFNLSPYGLWTIQVNPAAFENISAIEGVRLQFNVWYELAGGVPPAEFILFGGGDGGAQVPANICSNPPKKQ